MHDGTTIRQLGTINYDGGRNPEIYLGDCDWQPLDSEEPAARVRE